MTRRLVNIMDMPDPEAALLPCQHCGSTDVYVQNAGWQANTFMRCPGCKSTFSISGMGSHAETVAAWNRRHPPASREEGLSDALTKVRDAILSPINSSAIVDTVWMPVPGATFSIETLVDFIDAALQSKKPE
jgi:hypothetical protein